MIHSNRCLRSFVSGTSIAAMAMTVSMTVHAERVVFAGAEGSSNGSYSYLGTVIPMAGEQLGRGWYHKAVISMIRYRFESTERGAAEDVNGRAPGIEGGLGHAWQFGARTFDLSATVGYRHIRLAPFEPREEKTGSVLTLNPQVIAYTPLPGKFDADLIANYSFGLGSSFARLRAGFKPTGGWRTGAETKRLRGDSYAINTGGVFLSVPLNKHVTLDFTAGKEKPRDEPAASYGGIAFSVVF